MFYFTIVSSGYNCNKYRQRVDKKLAYLKNDLEALVRWEGTFNEECGIEQESKHKKILDIINQLNL